MFIDFIHHAYPLFIEEDFELLVENKKHNIFAKDIDVVRFIKRYNTIIYIVNLWNMGNVNLDTVIYRNNSYKEKLTQDFDKLNCSHVIVLNLLVTENKIEYYTQSEFYPDQEIYMITWIVNTSDKLINIPKEEVDEVLNVEKIIKRTFDIMNPNLNLETDINLLKYQDKLKKRFILNIKSENLLLTYGILVLNLVIWMSMEIKGGSQDINTLILFGANDPSLIINENQYWRLVSSMFLHIGISHLIYNSFALYIFGSRVEKYFGKIKFLFIYFISGITGSLASIFFSSTVSAGASGGIYGLLGALLILAYKTKREIEGLSAYTILIMILIGIGFGFTVPSIDNAAHLAGIISGVLVGNILSQYDKTKG